MNGTILRVCIRTTLRKNFDYLPPQNQSQSMAPGMRVRVPLGKSERIGIITEIVQQSSCDLHKLKPVIEIIDKEPLFPNSMLKLIDWASHYYHWPESEVFECALPALLRRGHPLNVDNKNDNNRPDIDINRDKKILNKQQEVAAHAIVSSLGQFQVFLLEGVTGSGKTEVYFQAIEKALSLNKQAMLLVPEIGLAPQMLERLLARFNVPIAMMHSSLSEKKRFLAWNMARTGEAPIVIGTRSAAFTPLHSPGIFIIDEEHDPSFKQHEGFRYNARDLIIMRANLEQSPVVLGSATPSLETLQNTQSNRYKHLRLSKRAGKAQSPIIKILDIRHKKLEAGLSSDLIYEIKNTLDLGKQAMLFLNRRGFAPILMCFDCGYIAPCKHCDAKLTLHYHPKRLRCHHCEASHPVFEECPTCSSRNLNPLGVGTERLQLALEQHFPNASIVRIDRDSTRKKGSLENAMEKIKQGEAHILLGTQMIAKGHHFPNVQLVAVIDIDNGLFSTDFRSTERMGQLLTQVAGRAGRENTPGICLLQTCHPEHPLLNLLLNKGFPAFSEFLLAERNNAHLPPFSHHALLRSEAKLNHHSLGFLKSIRDFVEKHYAKTLETLGPVAAPMERRAGYFHAQLLIQAKKRGQLQNVLREIVRTAEDLPLAKKVRWSLDVDPIGSM